MNVKLRPNFAIITAVQFSTRNSRLDQRSSVGFSSLAESLILFQERGNREFSAELAELNVESGCMNDSANRVKNRSTRFFAEFTGRF